MDSILEAIGLKKHYPVLGGVLKKEVETVKALDGINLSLQRGECLGLVGESGCGKTTLGKLMVKLHEPTQGDLFYYHEQGGTPHRLNEMSVSAMKKSGVRHAMQMVFQDPATSLNPRMLIKNIIAEPLKELGNFNSRELHKRVIEILEMVGLSDKHLMRYPHEFSGGQRQRIAIARAIAAEPKLIIFDEPTSALDVSVQAQILHLLEELRKEMGLTYMFITHHLLVVKYISNRIAVMYLGKIMELTESERLFRASRHPYTHALLASIPSLDGHMKKEKIVLDGDVPSPISPPHGCRFHPRCPLCISRCREEEPLLTEVTEGHLVACHRHEEISDFGI